MFKHCTPLFHGCKVGILGLLDGWTFLKRQSKSKQPQSFYFEPFCVNFIINFKVTEL